MLPRKYRLGKSKNFEKAFKSGRFVKGSVLSLKKAGNGLSFPRLGFVVGQKVAKKATERNKIKRKLSAAVEYFVKDISKGADVILLPTSDIVGKKYPEIKQQVEDLFKKANLL